MKLLLHSTQVDRPTLATLGMGYMLRALRDSNLFEIGSHDYYFSACKSFRATTVLANDKRILIDFWEYQAPAFTEEAYKENFDLIIKLQAIYEPFEYFLKQFRQRKLLPNQTDEEIQVFCSKIIPWSFFPSRLMEKHVGKESDLWSDNITMDGFFCGKDWRCRRAGKSFILKEGLEYISSDQETRNIISDDKFIQKMQESKFGIVLPGRRSWATEAKNRREIDYMMLKKPLLLTYTPYYYNPLIEGVHYIKWDGKKTLKQIESEYDIRKIGENGYEWYLNNATPIGLAKTFKKIVEEKLKVV